MDKPTRNLIQSATQRARRLLEDEFSQQLEGIYDILPDGTVLEQPGAHLDARARLVRDKIVAAIRYHEVGGMTAKDARDATLREAAFTTLNRFVALKMLEARGVVQECISKGEQSSGFREFGGLAEGLIALPDKGFRLYLESLFDEIGREVRVLFDRRDVAGLLWPRRQALNDLLATLNDPTLAEVWGEDETIGWIYQYFNGDDERKTMREASQAPRNSRELAVRNQFFTPRYVVAFLSDNTLGRTWYEMRKGNTRLVDQCHYLVCRPNEIFLAEGRQAPAASEDAEASEKTQEELLREPVYIPHRSLKDPREIQVLDPASGSGHFLLYCFDLLLTIYEEAWDDCPDLLRDIRTSTPAKADFMKQVPAMILRYNLHGIDIDARAAQIAELALWMRAQRAYATMNLRPTDRPPILRTNIVVAEPMPGDRAMLAEFLWDVDERLRPLVETIWEQMQLAGETGSLLKIEETIKSALDEARTESMVDVPPRQVTLFNPNQAPVQKVFTFASVEERAFWDQAEEHLLKTLENYARHASGAAGMRRRLFAENAAQGFAFIDLFRKQFDVMLMNPPFGLPSKSGKAYIEHNYPNSKRDLYSAFIDRALQLSFIDGLVGALTSRTGFFLNSFESWRNEVILKHTNITVFADLGDGVLDKALVETAAYCIQNKPANENASSIFIRLLDISDNKKEKELVRVISIDSNDEEKKFILKLSSLRAVPGSPFAYWVPSTLRNLFSYLDPVESNEREARVGVQTSDDFRFVRLWSEVPLNSLLKPSYKENEDPKKIQEHCIDSTRTYAVWVSFAKGGGFRQYSSNQHLVINWYQNGKELKVYNANLYGSVSRNVRSESHYFRPGITWSYLPLKRGSFRILPGGSIFSVGGPALFSNQESLLTILSVLNSDAFFALMRFFMPRGTGISQATLKFEVGYVQKVPFPNLSKNQIVMLSDLSIRIHDASRALDIYDELSPQFTIPLIIVDNHNIGLRESSFKSNQMVKLLNDRKLSLQEQIDRVVFEAYGLSTSLWCKTLYNQVKPT